MSNGKFEWLGDPIGEDAVASCMNRCTESLVDVYKMESEVWGGISDLYPELYEIGIRVLYERYCYAMVLVAYDYARELPESNDRRERYLSESTFAVNLDGCTTFAFRHVFGDMGLSNGVIDFFQEDYQEEYEQFWEGRRRLKLDILAVRKSFKPEERTILHGFADDENDYVEDFDEIFYEDQDDYFDEDSPASPEELYDDNEGKVEVCNLDYVHMMRIAKLSSDIDVGVFLNDTKGVRLPFIIEGFMSQPSEAIFAKPERAPSPNPERKKWWKFWE